MSGIGIVVPSVTLGNVALKPLEFLSRCSLPFGRISPKKYMLSGFPAFIAGTSVFLAFFFAKLWEEGTDMKKEIKMTTAAIKCWKRAALATTGLSLLVTVALPIDAALAQEEPGLRLEEILVTAQRREVGLQDASVAVTAVTGESLRATNVLSYADLARASAGVTFTEGSPLDQELQIRGVVSVRIDAPSADPSIGVFIDNAFVGRTGQLNSDFYDIDRVEIIRGPQGVLFGKAVVGGAFSIHTRKPEFEPGGELGVSYGNYNDFKAYGHVTGGLADELAGRFSFQIAQRDGFSRDILNQRDLEDKDTAQFRAQLLYEPQASDLSARLIFEYSDQQDNGIHRIGENIQPDFPGLKPFSRGRAVVAEARGGLGRRESLSTHPTFVGDNEPTPQMTDKEGWALTLNADWQVADHIGLEAVTSFRSADSKSLYSQTGIDPRNPYNATDTTVPLVFDSIVYEEEDFEQFSQELNFSYENPDSRFDILAGLYFQHQSIQKDDIFNAHSLPVVFGPTPIFAQTLSGESRWFNDGNNDTFGVFGQVGFQFTDELRLTAGGRFTRDEKDGTVQGLSTATGDFFNPTSTVPLTPLSPTFQLGGGFTTDYGDSWNKFTPQGTIEYTPNENLLVYATVSRGFKGGGFEDTPANPAAATAGFDPENVTNFELGGKLDFWDSRARINSSVFFMDYKDLQVTQTNDQCLCNITDNAADAEILGLEIEGQVQATRGLRLFAAGTYLDTEYKNFVDSLGNDNSGNRLQRTPEYTFNVGLDYSTDFLKWQNSLNFFVNYAYQGNFRWDPDNITREPGYGLLDARISFSPNDRYTFSVFGKNITDEDYRVFVINFLADEVAALGAPVTYGGEIRVSF